MLTRRRLFAAFIVVVATLIGASPPTGALKLRAAALPDKLSDEEKAEISARIEAVREALKGEDQGAVDSTKGQLAEALQRAGTRAYEATGTPGDGNGADGGPPPEGEAGEGTSEEEGETIEGEYKEV